MDQELKNDQLAIIKEVEYEDLKLVIKGFSTVFNENKDNNPFIRVYKHSENIFLITFPSGVDFLLFCYFINYLQFPEELDWEASVLGWATPTEDDDWVLEELIEDKVMLFVPDSDEEMENLYITSSDNNGYKLGLENENDNLILPQPLMNYINQPFEIEQLASLAFEDFK